MQLHVSTPSGRCLSSMPDNGSRLFLFAKVVRRRATTESDSALLSYPYVLLLGHCFGATLYYTLSSPIGLNRAFVSCLQSPRAFDQCAPSLGTRT